MGNEKFFHFQNELEKLRMCIQTQKYTKVTRTYPALILIRIRIPSKTLKRRDLVTLKIVQHISFKKRWMKTRWPDKREKLTDNDNLEKTIKMEHNIFIHIKLKKHPFIHIKLKTNIQL